MIVCLRGLFVPNATSCFILLFEYGLDPLGLIAASIEGYLHMSHQRAYLLYYLVDM